MNKIRKGEVKIYKGKEYIAIPEIEEESCTGCCFYDKGICSKELLGAMGRVVYE